MAKKKEEQEEVVQTPKMGKVPQKRKNKHLDPRKTALYDPKLAKHRRKEKARRKANQRARRRKGA